MKGQNERTRALWRTLRGCLLAACISLLSPMISTPEGITVVSGLSCVSHRSCPAGTFCTRSSFTSLPARSASCTSCWQCCLFPQVYGADTCSSRCRCSASQPCSLDADCGPGEFCAVLLSRYELPVCQPCQLCRNDSQAWSTSCAAACPSAALDDNGVPPGAEKQYMFAAFDLAEDLVVGRGFLGASESYDGKVLVTEDAVRMWLNDLPTYISDGLLSLAPTVAVQTVDGTPDTHATATATGSNRIVALGDIAIRLAAVSPHRDLLCPQLPNNINATTTTTTTSTTTTTTTTPTNTTYNNSTSTIATTNTSVTVPAGCPCSSTKTAASFRCPAGQRCSRRAWLSLPADVVTLGGTALLKARCVDCEPGSYCPEGTYVEERDDVDFMASLSCPAGYYCPTPAEKRECPAGYFCPARSTANTTCEYTALLSPQQQDNLQLANENGSKYIDRAQATFETITNDRIPLRGGFCPPRSATADQRCRPGYYCPDPSQELTCPAGYYCRAESIAPRKCPPLMLCSQGSQAPSVWPAAVAAFIGLALSVVVVGYFVTQIYDTSAQDFANTHDQDKRAAAARALRRFIARYHHGNLFSTTRKLWHVEHHMLELSHLKWICPGKARKTAVLDCVNGRFEAQHLSAILGPSGCGKSSLLALLAGRTTHWPLSDGEILVNGTKALSPRDLKYVTGFVPQDDILYAELTVQEMLDFSAALRLPDAPSRTASRNSSINNSKRTNNSGGSSGGGHEAFDESWISSPVFMNTLLPTELSTRTTGIGTADGDSGISNPGLGTSNAAEASEAQASSSRRYHDNNNQDQYGNKSTGDNRNNTHITAAAGDAATAGGGGGSSPGPIKKLSTSLTFTATVARRKLVDEVLQMLDLHMLRDQRVGSVAEKSLSGGQRKRVNIGVELVARPPVLLLDEPTSGLDAACSSDVLMSLSDLAEDHGFNVIMAIHQPRRTLYDLFNKVMLLDRHGRSVYHGEPLIALDYFSNVLGYKHLPRDENVADTLLDIIMGKYYSELYKSDELPVTMDPSGGGRSPAALTSPKSPPGGTATATANTAIANTATSCNHPGNKDPNATANIRVRSTRTPQLSEGLVKMITLEYDNIFGEPGAADRGRKLNRSGLRKLLRNFGQKGPDTEAFVKGILEEVVRLRMENQPPQLPPQLPPQQPPQLPPQQPPQQPLQQPEGGGSRRSQYLALSDSLNPFLRYQQHQQQNNSNINNSTRIPHSKPIASSTSKAGALSPHSSLVLAEAAVSRKELLAVLQRVLDGKVKHRRDEECINSGKGLRRTSNQHQGQLSIKSRGSGPVALVAAVVQKMSRMLSRRSPPVGRGASHAPAPSTGSGGVMGGALHQHQHHQHQHYYFNHHHHHTQDEEAGIQGQMSAGAAVAGSSNIQPLQITHTASACSSSPQNAKEVAQGGSLIRGKISIIGSGGTATGLGVGGGSGGGGDGVFSPLRAPATASDTPEVPANTMVASISGGGTAATAVVHGQQHQQRMKLGVSKLQLPEDDGLMGAAATATAYAGHNEVGDNEGDKVESSTTTTSTGDTATATTAAAVMWSGFQGAWASNQTPKLPTAEMKMVNPPLPSPTTGPPLPSRSSLPVPSAFAEPVSLYTIDSSTADSTTMATSPRGGGGGVAGGGGEPTNEVPALMSKDSSSGPNNGLNRNNNSNNNKNSLDEGPSDGAELRLTVRSCAADAPGIGNGSGNGGSNNAGVAIEVAPAKADAATEADPGVGGGSGGAAGKPRPGGPGGSTSLITRSSSRAQATAQCPSWASQLITFTRRASLQSARAFWLSSMLEAGLLLVAAAAVGANQGTDWGPTDVPGKALMAMMCLAVLAVVQHLRTFASNSLVLQRERGVGLSVSAYFIARCLADLPWIVIAPIYFSLPYYILTVPRAPYLPSYYIVSLGIWWWASGLSYWVTVLPFLPRAATPTAAVLVTLIAGALLNGINAPTLSQSRGTFTEVVLGMSYNRWAIEALTISELDEYFDSHSNIIAAMYRNKGICGIDKVLADGNGSGNDGGGDGSDNTVMWEAIGRFIGSGDSGASFTRGYCSNAFRNSLVVLFCLGLGLRVIACLTLAHDQRLMSYSFAVLAWLQTQCLNGSCFAQWRRRCLRCFSVYCLGRVENEAEDEVNEEAEGDLGQRREEEEGKLVRKGNQDGGGGGSGGGNWNLESSDNMVATATATATSKIGRISASISDAAGVSGTAAMDIIGSVSGEGTSTQPQQLQQIHHLHKRMGPYGGGGIGIGHGDGVDGVGGRSEPTGKDSSLYKLNSNITRIEEESRGLLSTA